MLSSVVHLPRLGIEASRRTSSPQVSVSPNRPDSMGICTVLRILLVLAGLLLVGPLLVGSLLVGSLLASSLQACPVLPGSLLVGLRLAGLLFQQRLPRRLFCRTQPCRPLALSASPPIAESGRREPRPGSRRVFFIIGGRW